MSTTEENTPNSPLAIFMALVLFCSIIVFSILSLNASNSTGLKVYGTVPEFDLIDQNSNKFSKEKLQGKIWVADFIFTSCTEECPLMNIEMQKINSAYPQKVALTSFTVDPKVDTPERLLKYANALGADPNQWHFVTGTKEALHNLAIKGFKLAVQENNPHDAHGAHDAHDAHSNHENHGSAQSSPFLHSQKFVLVDTKGQIRGYYDSTLQEDVTRLIQKDIPALLEEK